MDKENKLILYKDEEGRVSVNVLALPTRMFG